MQEVEKAIVERELVGDVALEIDGPVDGTPG